MSASFDDAPRRGRRTRAATLAAVVEEVARMQAAKISGPTALVAERLAERGIAVSVSTLLVGDCRPHVELVWRRRRSVRSFGPTGRHDLRGVEALVDEVIALRWKVGRIEADLKGELFDRAQSPDRDPRSKAVCARHAAGVVRRAAEIGPVLRALMAKGLFPTFDNVAAALTSGGHPISARSLRRQDVYSRPILAARGEEPPLKPHDPERKGLRRKSAEELGAIVYALNARLREVEAEFGTSLN
jgi:hypothetical protein